MKLYHLLISFCNNTYASMSPLLCVSIPEHWQTDDFRFAPVYAGFPEPISTVSGLSKQITAIYALSHGDNAISVLDNNLEPKYFQHLPEVSVPHSSLIVDNYFYITSTGSDQVLRYEIGDEGLNKPEVIWEASSLNTDTQHINSIAELDGELYISAFGPKTGKLHSSARKGYIHNISQNFRVKDGIHHPHTLSTRNGRLYYCESALGSFCSLDEALLKINGYARGMAWISDEIVCLSTSIGRTVSRSTGMILNPKDPGRPIGTCGIVIYNIKTKEILNNIDLSWFGPEIYDILKLDNQVDISNTIWHSFLKERNELHETYIKWKAVENYSQSNSWKITAPMRSMMRLYRKIRNKR